MFHINTIILYHYHYYWCTYCCAYTAPSESFDVWIYYIFYNAFRPTRPRPSNIRPNPPRASRRRRYVGIAARTFLARFPAASANLNAPLTVVCFAEIEVRRRIVRVSIMEKASGQSVRQCVHIQRDQRRQIFVGRRRKTACPRGRPVRLLVSERRIATIPSVWAVRYS